MLRSLVVVFASTLLSSVALAQIHVPGDFADLQDAIDAASPGDVIVVHGGTFQAITIDKALTLLGSPPPLLEPTPNGSGYLAPITLAGPGSGEVVLSRIRTGGTAVGFTQSFNTAGILGGGFDELHLYDCDVHSPEWCCLTGLGTGQPGVSVTVPFVLVERSSVTGSATNIDDTMMTSGWPGPPGIDAPSSTVVVLDSSVRGGASAEFTFPSFDCGGSCPNGSGGAGVVADVLYYSDSALDGGAAARWRDPMGNTCCSSGTVGAPFVANTVNLLGNALDADGPPRLGSTYVLHVASGTGSRATSAHPGPAAVLKMSNGIDAPVNVGGLGALFLSGAPVSLGVVPAFGDVGVPLPLDLTLYGREVAFQLLGRPSGYSRPLSGVLLLPTLVAAEHADPTETRSR